MIVKKKVQLITWIITMSLAVIAIFGAIIGTVDFFANSQSDALTRAGLNEEGLYVVDIIHDDNTEMKYYVVQTTTVDEGGIIFAVLSRSPYGIWNSINQVSGTIECEDGKQMSNIHMIVPEKFRAYPARDEVPIRYSGEAHYYYCGNNALKEVKLELDQIPENAHIEFQQNGEYWWMHMIYSEMVTGNSYQRTDMDVVGKLIENGCISGFAN